MKIVKAEFIKSSDCLKNCPETDLPEIALIGRSNVGKSSFINKFCNRKNLAKTSNTPGKTRLMNYFNINDEFMIVDLPGYGYAKVSKDELNKWKIELENYLLKRDNLKGVIQFIDARHDIQKNDLQMREWLEYNKINILTVATKMDYISKNKSASKINELSEILNSEVIGFSAKTGDGIKDISNLVQNLKN
ncbi:MAG: ribosome biogenesis GTP-binding protein YihA/YsxC [Candidatus Gastranaerophilaceae bacterium]|jgi:GTP-binding protein